MTNGRNCRTKQSIYTGVSGWLDAPDPVREGSKHHNLMASKSMYAYLADPRELKIEKITQLFYNKKSKKTNIYLSTNLNPKG